MVASLQVLAEPYSLLLGHIPLFFAVRRAHLKDAGASVSFFLRFLILHWETYFPACVSSSPGKGGAENKGSPPPVIYLDLWPLVSQPIAIVNDAALCQIIVSERVPIRHEQGKQLSRSIAGPRNLFEWDGALHRLWRTRLNPGFSMKNLLGHVAMGRLVDEVEVFADTIKGSAGSSSSSKRDHGEEGDGGDDDDDDGWGEVFQMFPRAVALTFDIICSVAL